MAKKPPPEPFVVAGSEIPPGKRQRLDLEVARLPTGSWLSLPLMVIHGKKEGPAIWLSAALHGDEIIGVEIIREVVGAISPKKLRGTIIAAPIVNVFGFISETRELPDGRDLNRSFPGSKGGSLASRLANLFLTEVVDKCRYGIDYHSATDHRSNYPHLRVDPKDQVALDLSQAFAAPVLVQTSGPKGSLRQAAGKRDCHVIVFEGGAPHRFDNDSIRCGFEGTMRVLEALEMLPKTFPEAAPPIVPEKTKWVRARRSGIFRHEQQLGSRVEKGQKLGMIADSFGKGKVTVKAPRTSIILSFTENPLVSQGDALFHLAYLSESEA